MLNMINSAAQSPTFGTFRVSTKTSMDDERKRHYALYKEDLQRAEENGLEVKDYKYNIVKDNKSEEPGKYRRYFSYTVWKKPESNTDEDKYKALRQEKKLYGDKKYSEYDITPDIHNRLQKLKKKLGIKK